MPAIFQSDLRSHKNKNSDSTGITDNIHTERYSSGFKMMTEAPPHLLGRSGHLDFSSWGRMVWNLILHRKPISYPLQKTQSRQSPERQGSLGLHPASSERQGSLGLHPASSAAHQLWIPNPPRQNPRAGML